jgi:hypothetical protein
MCNLYSETKGQAAIRGLFRVQQDAPATCPPFRRSSLTRWRLSCAMLTTATGNSCSRAGVCQDRSRVQAEIVRPR